MLTQVSCLFKRFECKRYIVVRLGLMSVKRVNGLNVRVSVYVRLG